MKHATVPIAFSLPSNVRKRDNKFRQAKGRSGLRVTFNFEDAMTAGVSAYSP